MKKNSKENPDNLDIAFDIVEKNRISRQEQARFDINGNEAGTEPSSDFLTVMFVAVFFGKLTDPLAIFYRLIFAGILVYIVNLFSKF